VRADAETPRLPPAETQPPESPIRPAGDMIYGDGRTITRYGSGQVLGVR
jgi:hypothetical protein